MVSYAIGATSLAAVGGGGGALLERLRADGDSDFALDVRIQFLLAVRPPLFWHLPVDVQQMASKFSLFAPTPSANFERQLRVPTPIKNKIGIYVWCPWVCPP
eukprot:SAG11_NODE_772_length_7254_cov_1.857582_8_plen_102_part_00